MQPHAGFDPSTFYYFFSTTAQAIAAVVGLSAALAIFRYQALLNRIDTAAETIVRYFGESDLAQHWPWDTDGLPSQHDFVHSTTANGHMNMLRPFFRHRSGLLDSQVRASVEGVYRNTPREALTKLGSFKNVRASYAKYETMVREARKLRRLTIVATTYGLVIMTISLGFGLSPERHELLEYEALPAIFIGFVSAYVMMAIYLTMIAFADPHKDR